MSTMSINIVYFISLYNKNKTTLSKFICDVVSQMKFYPFWTQRSAKDQRFTIWTRVEEVIVNQRFHFGIVDRPQETSWLLLRLRL